MKRAIREKRISQFFRLTIFLKGIYGALEMMIGVMLIFISPTQLTQFVVWMTHGELIEDPNDLVANYLLRIATQLSLSSIMFGALYLLSHGILKLILVIGLLKKRLWAYPWSLVLFSLLITYQIYRVTLTYSVGLFFLTLFDLIVICLIWHEYKILRKQRD